MIPAHLLDRPFACECGRTHHIPTRHITIGRGALEALPEALAAAGRPKGLLAVSDSATRSAAWEAIASRLVPLGIGVTEVVLPAGPHGPPLADESNRRRIQQAVRPDTDAILAVGSGTINDLAKVASRTCGKPYLVCATAPSMNGYPSTNASLLEAGLKVTRPGQGPSAILADLAILCAAPLPMIRAGLGDLLSQQTALVDWRLASLVQGTAYCAATARLVAGPIQRVIREAEAIGRRQETAVGELTEALILSGFTMVMAGQSSPASGAEHLISHYWEMEAALAGREEPLHGAQVGVTCILTAHLMARLADRAVRDLPGPPRNLPDAWEAAEPLLAARHGSLWAVVRQEARAKHLAAPDRVGRFAMLGERWAEIWAALGPLRPDPGSLQSALERAGAPTTPTDLEVTADAVERALVAARDIRNRYTVLDLATEVGLLEGWAKETAGRSAPEIAPGASHPAGQE
ncbi:MAG: sn-glycerol-1-phosphate dehydrogenase [candidate division NC10 bacterium]|nr:sn-glycerol-1-phosphate dehydrogenase [candidate division NC10 bacterium]